MSWFTRHAARRSRKWLHETGADMAALLDSAADSLWAVDAHKRFVFGNRTFIESMRDAFGIDVEPGVNLVEALEGEHPLVANRWSDLYDRGLRGEHVTEEQSFQLHGVDRSYLVSIQPIHRHGAIVGVSALSKDVTAMKDVERSLRAAEERFARVFYVSPAPIVITAWKDGRIIDTNTAFADMFGYRREEMIGRTTIELGLWPNPEARKRIVQEVLRSGSIWGLELEIRKRSGQHGFLLGGFVLTDIGGQKCMVGVAEEITERKEWEERERRTARVEAIGQLASGVAHEFNNLLTVIMGGTELLQRPEPSPEAKRRAVDKVHAAAVKAAHLTQQLLAFGRRQPLKPSTVGPNELVGDLVALLHKTLGEQITLRQSIAEDLPPLWVDRSQLEQSLLNLAINAREAMPLGGTLTFRTRLANETLDRPGDVPAGPLVELQVSDTGVGMDRETLTHLFEPFYTTHEPGRGSGLGLSMVLGMVRQSHGFIRVESEPGQGTTFHLYFPPAEVVPRRAEPQVSLEAEAEQHAR